jgi:hypothetical protein
VEVWKMCREGREEEEEKGKGIIWKGTRRN